MNAFLLLVACYVHGSHADHLRGRQAEFEKIGKYETLRFDPAAIESSGMLEFDAFGQHYQIALRRNERHVPAHIQPVNIDPLEHADEPHFTSLTESCHYIGKVLNKADDVDDEEDEQSTSLVSLTMCNKRGIRAHIRAFNETLFIYPSAYYLDHSREFYSFDEEHIVWRVSDLAEDPNHPFPPQPEGAHAESALTAQDEMLQTLRPKVEQRAKESDREHRRLAFNSGASLVELYLVSGPVRSQSYYDAGGAWFETMMADYYDIFGTVTAIYQDTAWGDAIGQISISISQVEVLFNFEGTRYSDLAPRFLYSNAMDLGCTDAPGLDQSQNPNCRIDSDTFANQLKAWASEKTNPEQYDVLHFVMDIPPKPDNAGKAWYSGICSLSGYGTGYSSSFGSSNDWFRKVIAHELGHNFNIAHDGEGNTCSATSSHIMASGTEGFSSCSITYMQERFEATGGLPCLADGLRPFASNADNSGIIPTPKPTIRPTASCFTVEGLQTEIDDRTVSWSGTYEVVGSTGAGLPYYKRTTDARYIYFGTDNGVYCVSDNFESGACSGHYAHCQESTKDFEQCSEWEMYNWGHGGWDLIDNVAVTDCGNDPVSAPTDPPTPPPVSAPAPGTTTTTTTTSTTTTTTTTTTTSSGGDILDTTDCVTIADLAPDLDGTDYNGRWEQTGTVGGKPLYEMDGLDDRYLCFRESSRRWLISADPSCPWYTSMYGLCFEEEFSMCNDQWIIKTTAGWAYDQSSTASFCNAFIFDTCLELTGLQENVCMSSNRSDSLWDGATTFTNYEKMRCRNDRPVYHYTVYNESITDPDATGFIVERYFLHYWQFQGFAKWIISRNEIRDINIVAECSSSSLLDCSQGGWTVLHETYDSSRMVDEPSMSVNNYECGYVAAEVNDEGSNNAIMYVVVAIVALVVIVAVAVLVYCCVSKNRYERPPPEQEIGTIGMDGRQGYDMQTLNETAGIEVDVEIEVPINSN